MTIVYQTSVMGEADLRVALVERDQADLLVYKTPSAASATKSGRWYLTRRREEADCIIYVGPVGFAKVTICFVASPAEAGWQGQRPAHSLV